jgi:hypothetical protein
MHQFCGSDPMREDEGRRASSAIEHDLALLQLENGGSLA